MSNETVDIQPEVGMYAAFARLNYKPWFALGEFVDNAIQSYLANSKALKKLHGELPQLEITIAIDRDQIVITDTAAGICWDDFPRAFTPAQPPPDATGLSEFGLGMKAAASWFCNKWSVRTSALGESCERTVELDIKKIVKNGIRDIPVWKKNVSEKDHYTELTLSDLRREPKGRTLTKIKDHLTSIYRRFLDPDHRKGQQIKIDLRYPGGETYRLGYEKPRLVTMPRVPTGGLVWVPGESSPTPDDIYWRHEFEIEINKKETKSIKGWVGLLEKMDWWGTSSRENSNNAFANQRATHPHHVGFL